MRTERPPSNIPPDDPASRTGWWRRPASRHVAVVAILYFSSGLPLGLIWIAVPDWMRSQGVDIRITGLFTLAQAPWTFKVLWSPLLDRWSPPWLGRRRGWAAIAQLALALSTFALAGVGHSPETPWVVLALALGIAFAGATQDIALDAYSVELLRTQEQGVAVGLRTATYRAAMFLAGGAAITLAASVSWPVVCASIAAVYLPMIWVSARAPEPERMPPPPETLKRAVWEPFVGLLARPRALEILAFVVLYKLADNLAQSLLRPFLVDCGYGEIDRGLALATVGTVMTLAGTFMGGALTTTLGLTRALWLFGGLQIVSNVGYLFVAELPPGRALLLAAMSFETVCTGLGMGAFGVLLLRLTERRFSATQYAVLSSLFGLPRVLAGPVTGVLVDAIGWTWFFAFTMVAGLPGLALLQRFAPWRERELRTELQHASVPAARAAPRSVARAGLVGASATTLLVVVCLTGLEMLEGVRVGAPSAWGAALRSAVWPTTVGGGIGLAGALAAGACGGLFAAAATYARGRR